jgi:hypothetical protein
MKAIRVWKVRVSRMRSEDVTLLEETFPPFSVGLQPSGLRNWLLLIEIGIDSLTSTDVIFSQHLAGLCGPAYGEFRSFNTGVATSLSR